MHTVAGWTGVFTHFFTPSSSHTACSQVWIWSSRLQSMLLLPAILQNTAGHDKMGDVEGHLIADCNKWGDEVGSLLLRRDFFCSSNSAEVEGFMQFTFKVAQETKLTCQKGRAPDEIWRAGGSFVTENYQEWLRQIILPCVLLAFKQWPQQLPSLSEISVV